MVRWTLLVGWILVGVVPEAFDDPPASSAPRPHILFLFADDHRADAIGAHGNPHIRTPEIDRIAAGGFSFRTGRLSGRGGTRRLESARLRRRSARARGGAESDCGALCDASRKGP